MPDDPKTATDTAAPPPKEPPVVNASAFTPKPPPDPSELFKKPVKISSPAQAISNRKIYYISDNELIAAFKDKPLYVLDRVNWSRLKSPYRKRLENLINQDPALKKILDYVLPVYPPAAPQAQPQPQPAAVQEIPPVTAEQLSQQEPAVPLKENDITAENAPAIEAWMNGLKDHVYNSFAQSARRNVGQSQQFTQNLLGSLALYRGGLPAFYLSEGSKELIFSALGPIGAAFRTLEEKDVQRKMSWMKNPLNPNAVNYYLTSLPNQMAFKVLYLPAKAAFGILARGGAPLISKVHYQEFGQTKQSYVFTPLLRATQFSNKLADGLDKLSGVVTDDFVKYRGEKSPYDRYIESKNLAFSNALKELKKAKVMGQPSRIFGANKKIKNLLKQHDGNILKSILKPGLTNTARRLRQHHRDPISFLLSLIGGGIWDLIATLTVRPLLALATRAINLIPGVAPLRAQLTEFFTSNRWLQTARIGGTSISSFVKGTLSPTTASSAYLGVRWGGLLSDVVSAINPQLGAALRLPLQVGFGATWGGFGAFYNTALKMSADSAIAKWLNKGEFIKGFGPGPFTSTANWLSSHPFARLPINGLAVGNLLSPLMQKLYGWSPLTTQIVFTAADYLWQIKGPLLQKIGAFISELPVIQRLVASIQFGLTFPLQNWWYNLVYKATAFEQSLIGKMPVAWEMRPWAKFAQTFFNPGFFIGFGLVPALTPFIGAWSYLVGPIAGSLGWNLAAYGLQKIFGTGIASMSRINAVGWTGYIFGSILDFLIPGAQPLLPIFTSLAFVGIDMALLATHTSLLTLASGTLAWLGTAIPLLSGLTGTIAAGLAAWATVISVASIAGLTVFFAYTIYAGFWVPMIEESRAGPQSSNFSINTNVQEIAPNKFEVCSSFSLTNNVFNSEKFLDHNTDFIRSDLTVDLNNPAATTDAFRGISLIYTTYVTEWVNGTNYSMIIPQGNIVNDVGANPYLDSFLPTPSDQTQNLFELMSQNASVVYSMKPFFDILTRLAQEYKPCPPNPRVPCDQTSQLIAEYEAQLKLMKEQEKLVDDLIGEIKDGDLDGALTKANEYLPPPASRNPLSDPCPDPTQPCPEEKQGLKKLYDSWEPMVKRYINTIENYQSQTDPNLDNFLAQLEQESEGLKQQIDLLPNIIDQMKRVQNDMTEEDAAKILNTNFLNFTNMTPAEQRDVWDNLLHKYFPEVFDESRKFYFIPQGTNYRLCIDADYSGPPGVPQTVCSTISYTPSIWGPDTGFAKSCTTFTPK